MIIDISELTLEVPFPVFLPVGLPQGLRIEPTSKKMTGGLITCGGKRINLDPISYSLWLIMQMGLSEKQLKERFRTQLGGEGFDSAMKNLTQKKLIRRLASKDDLEVFGLIRVVPKATGMGSLDSDHPLRYAVKPNFGDKEVVMNPLDYAIWTMWDGKVTLMSSWRETAATFKLKPEQVIPRQVGILILLLGQGLVNVDYT